ncbi:unnamed protein product [Litomosoides sigmodontis]|uniref:Gem-associated protein 2 n=1 Tax=Litomosoides sigmodontis TaxID=42156 RepID=A0A3P6TCQ7_LITSI|nr:unnamed protein product [Litomosoides sigmodontis]
MEQEAVFDVGDFDERDISLAETPLDPLHYLQQYDCIEYDCNHIKRVFSRKLKKWREVGNSAKGFEWFNMVSMSRAHCPEVVAAKTIPQKTVSSAISKDLLFSCGPPSEWSVAMKDPDEWRIFCLEERNNSFPMKEEDVPRFAHHRGNPPTLRLVFSLSEQQVNTVIQYLIDVFLEEGYTRSLFEWIYALMLVLQKPLTHDVCSSIRQLAKRSRVLRNTLNEETQNGSTMREEFSLFIAVVGVYFEQLDIADQISS